MVIKWTDPTPHQKVKQSITTSVASAVGLTADAVAVDVSAGSVILRFLIRTSSSKDAAQLQAQLAHELLRLLLIEVLLLGHVALLRDHLLPLRLHLPFHALDLGLEPLQLARRAPGVRIVLLQFRILGLERRELGSHRRAASSASRSGSTCSQLHS